MHRRTHVQNPLLDCCTVRAQTEENMHAGRVYSAEAVGRVAQREGITYLLDACQSVGQMPLDVQALGCDYLTGTGRKYLRGPRGSGFLYASRQAVLSVFQSPMLTMLIARKPSGNWGFHVCMNMLSPCFLTEVGNVACFCIALCSQQPDQCRACSCFICNGKTWGLVSLLSTKQKHAATSKVPASRCFKA